MKQWWSEFSTEIHTWSTWQCIGAGMLFGMILTTTLIGILWPLLGITIVYLK